MHLSIFYVATLTKDFSFASDTHFIKDIDKNKREYTIGVTESN